MFGSYFHHDVSSWGRLAAATVFVDVAGFVCTGALSKYTIYLSSSDCDTAITVQHTKDTRTKTTLQRLPIRTAAKYAILKSGKSQFCWRKTEPWDASSWRGLNSCLLGFGIQRCFGTWLAPDVSKDRCTFIWNSKQSKANQYDSVTSQQPQTSHS